MTVSRRNIVRMVGFLTVLFLTSAPVFSKVRHLSDFLPSEKQISPWQKDGSFRVYAGKGLQKYLDGGADIYLEYGFRAAGVQAYKKGQQALQVEIYRMTSSQAALGIFSFRRHFPADSSMAFPNESSQYDFLFAKGHYFVAVTNMDGGSDTAHSLKKFAGFIAQNIAGKTPAPNLFAALPRRGLVPWSPMFINGPLAMRVRWPIGEIHCFHFERGTRVVTGRYQADKLDFALFVVFPGKRVDFYSLVECFGNILNAAMVVKSNQKIVLTMMNSRKTIFLKKGQNVWIIPNLFDDLPVLKFLGEM